MKTKQLIEGKGAYKIEVEFESYTHAGDVIDTFVDNDYFKRLVKATQDAGQSLLLEIASKGVDLTEMMVFIWPAPYACTLVLHIDDCPWNGNNQYTVKDLKLAPRDRMDTNLDGERGIHLTVTLQDVLFGKDSDHIDYG